VIHRDLKPGNIMLGPYGETLLVDWGLARRIDVPDPETTVIPGMEPLRLDARGRSSIPGAVQGTPAYMSPEQARGETNRVGPLSDVFGLGATLYTVLTGRPPYEGPEAVERAREGRFVPASGVRRDVPRALEAICLKAMALRPEDRYAGPKDLAQDVERWLADEPVAVYREPLAVRAARWLRRHRTLATSSVAALAVVTVSLAVFGGILSAKNSELRTANDELDRRAETERRHREAIEALEIDSDRVLRDNLAAALLEFKDDERPTANARFRALIDRAGGHYERAVLIHPNPDRARVGLAVTRYLKLRDRLPGYGTDSEVQRAIDEIEPQLREAISADPRDSLVAYVYGLLCSEVSRALLNTPTTPTPSARARASTLLARAHELLRKSETGNPGVVLITASIVVNRAALAAERAVPAEDVLHWLRETIPEVTALADRLDAAPGLDQRPLDEVEAIELGLRGQMAEVQGRANPADAIRLYRAALQESHRSKNNVLVKNRMFVEAGLRSKLARALALNRGSPEATDEFAHVLSLYKALATALPISGPIPVGTGPTLLTKLDVPLTSRPVQCRYLLTDARLSFLKAARAELLGGGVKADRRKALVKLALECLDDVRSVEPYNGPDPKWLERLFRDMSAWPEFRDARDAFDRDWWLSRGAKNPFVEP
jgi:serine/threonine protein kinase